MAGEGVWKTGIDFIPESPGVYVFKDAKGRVIYVGKAKSLRDRLKAYVQPAQHSDYKGRALRDQIDGFEVTVCPSEVEALILEAELIKKYKPRFNVLLRDDKSYPYIAITLSERFPRAILTRGRKVPGYKYYGPYVNAQAARRTLALLQRVFPLRHCKGAHPGERGRSPCLYYEMEMCMGPCRGDIDRDSYAREVGSLCQFLEGKHQTFLKNLELEMKRAAQNMEFERAARIRNQIEAARKVLSHGNRSSTGLEDYDVIGYSRDELEAAFVVARYRSGAHLGNFCMYIKLSTEITDKELVTEFIKRYYADSSSIPPLVVVSVKPQDESVEDWLSSLRSSRAEIRVPLRGTKRKNLALACENAALALEKSKAERMSDRENLDKALKELTLLLGLGRYPLRIECYDVSTMMGTASVGSMVVFEDGIPRRSHYRKFKIKHTPGINDVGMMSEILMRRFKSLTEEPRKGEEKSKVVDSSFARKPDLVIVDGGKGQLGAALKVFEKIGLAGTEFAALAKRLEEIYRPGIDEPIILPRNSEALFLVQRIRDEAHRFAVSYHKKLMEKRISESWLDDVAGVGPGRKRKLIEHFGSPSKVAEASLDELKRVPGIPSNVAKALLSAARSLHKYESKESSGSKFRRTDSPWNEAKDEGH